MKKTLKKIAAAILTVGMAISGSTTIFAESSNQMQKTVNIDGTEMLLISEKTSIEDGWTVINRTYSSVNPKLKSSSGSATYREEKELVYDPNNLVYWVQGYFTWNQAADTVTISNVKYGYTPLGNITTKNHNIEYASNQGATVLFGKKYAYARYTFTAVNPVGLEKFANVYIDMNVAGESSHN